MSEWFVVLAFNQTGGTPRIVHDGHIYDDREAADDDAMDFAAASRAGGRLDTYHVFRLEEE